MAFPIVSTRTRPIDINAGLSAGIAGAGAAVAGGITGRARAAAEESRFARELTARREMFDEDLTAQMDRLKYETRAELERDKLRYSFQGGENAKNRALRMALGKLSDATSRYGIDKNFELGQDRLNQGDRALELKYFGVDPKTGRPVPAAGAEPLDPVDVYKLYRPEGGGLSSEEDRAAFFDLYNNLSHLVGQGHGLVGPTGRETPGTDRAGRDIEGGSGSSAPSVEAPGQGGGTTAQGGGGGGTTVPWNDLTPAQIAGQMQGAFGSWDEAERFLLSENVNGPAIEQVKRIMFQGDPGGSPTIGRENPAREMSWLDRQRAAGRDPLADALRALTGVGVSALRGHALPDVRRGSLDYR